MHIAKDWEPADFVMFGTRGNLLNLGQKCCFIQKRLDGYLMSKKVNTSAPIDRVAGG